MKQSPAQNVVITCGLSGDTNIITSDGLDFIKLSAAVIVSGSPINTFALSPALSAIEAEVQYIVGAQANGLKTIQLSNGLVLKCTPSTHFLAEGCMWVPTMNLERDDKIIGYKYTEEEGLKPVTYEVDSISESHNGLFEQVYGVITSVGSILLPYLDENTGELSLIPVLQ